MEELGPVIAGVLLAGLLSRLDRAGVRRALVVLVALAVGLGWSRLVGELDRHWAFALVDAVQVVVAYGLTRWLVARQVLPSWRRGKPPPARDV